MSQTALPSKEEVEKNNHKEDSIRKINFAWIDLKENVLRQFLSYINITLKPNEECGSTFDFEGDLTNDGKDDEIIYYEIVSKRTSEILKWKMCLFVNEKGIMKQYPDFEPNYPFSVGGIENNSVLIAKLKFIENDEPRLRTVETRTGLKLNEKKEFIEVK
ncbi:hypothetical protein FNW52_11485 [Flavobacterium sp. ZT3R18]|uniref:hypothetical protein n=1 Tax=Flavobacterium sp. ZT3R18 TaxID=2594429 RepID=UPI001179EAC3|nr:hypothetical protein [Flavobacterium sp. ZT3R18]TRX35335.1 hypothetical protein FNW52_11485 [Flavobacterium sp. ZT3R18]